MLPTAVSYRFFFFSFFFCPDDKEKRIDDSSMRETIANIGIVANLGRIPLNYFLSRSVGGMLYQVLDSSAAGSAARSLRKESILNHDCGLGPR